ncbi:glycosyltransferase [Pseudopedobacter beijingensis]|uniref:Glycosyltransferase n=1 Tax=Pseudopedobacter beijingensis TaxID=1207056 RepID=A0ABW4I8H4_9SPHI
MVNKHVCIVTQAHLCSNPRVVKEACLLAEMGFKVSILTCKYEEKVFLADKQLIPSSVELKPFADLSNKKLKTFILKMKRKTSILAFKKLNIKTPGALGYGYQLLLKKALQENADLYICHQEMATIAGTALIKKGKKVAFDLEDWYSEDLTENARAERPITLLKKHEKIALTQGLFCITTSNSMAEAMAEYYRTSKPSVVYNTFKKRKPDQKVIEKDRNNNIIPSLIWFSQTIGPGRGLEKLIEALNMINTPVQLHLRGRVNLIYKEQLLSTFNNTRHKIYFHELINPDELPYRLAQHDIGLALEPDNPLNTNLTISNKIIQYLQAGLAVIASNTKGQSELAQKANDCIRLFNQDDAVGLAKHIENLITQTDELRTTKKKSLEIFEHKLCWEIEKEKYKEIILQSLF